MQTLSEVSTAGEIGECTDATNELLEQTLSFAILLREATRRGEPMDTSGLEGTWYEMVYVFLSFTCPGRLF